MPTLDNASLGDGLFTMLKGEPGTRKSTCALSYPRPQYWISTDQKMEALRLPASRWGINLKEVEYDDYSDWNAPNARLEGLQVNCPYKTIIVDSVTSIADAMNRQTKRFKVAEGGGKKVGGMATNSIEDYNAEASAFQDLLAMLKDIRSFHKVNIILIAHVVGQRVSNDANKLTHHSRVIITGGDKISGKIASYMTEAYHFNIDAGFNADSGDGKFGLFTQHTGADYARTSLPLPAKIIFNDEPLYDKWIRPAIEKQMKESPVSRIEAKPKPTGFSA